MTIYVIFLTFTNKQHTIILMQTTHVSIYITAVPCVTDSKLQGKGPQGGRQEETVVSQQRELFHWKSTVGAAIVAIQVNNYMDCLQELIEKFLLYKHS